MAKELSLGWPDSQTVEVFLDGNHVATMTNAKGHEDGIPVELFNLMRAAPDLLDELKTLVEYLREEADSGVNEDLTFAHSAAVKAINKAEGRDE